VGAKYHLKVEVNIIKHSFWYQLQMISYLLSYSFLIYYSIQSKHLSIHKLHSLVINSLFSHFFTQSKLRKFYILQKLTSMISAFTFSNSKPQTVHQYTTAGWLGEMMDSILKPSVAD